MADGQDKIKLTEKQEKFCNEYLVDLNATAAAKRAGYSPETAYSIGWENLRKPEIVTRIGELRAGLSESTLVTPEFVLEGLKETAQRCLQKVPVMKWDYSEKKMVQETDEEGNGVWAFDSSGANKAFELLGKHVGLFEKDNKQKSAVINVNLTDDGDDG